MSTTVANLAVFVFIVVAFSIGWATGESVAERRYRSQVQPRDQRGRFMSKKVNQ